MAAVVSSSFLLSSTILACSFSISPSPFTHLKHHHRATGGICGRGFFFFFCGGSEKLTELFYVYWPHIGATQHSILISTQLTLQMLPCTCAACKNTVFYCLLPTNNLFKWYHFIALTIELDLQIWSQPIKLPFFEYLWKRKTFDEVHCRKHVAVALMLTEVECVTDVPLF